MSEMMASRQGGQARRVANWMASGFKPTRGATRFGGKRGGKQVGAMRWTGRKLYVVVSGIACDGLRFDIIRYPIRDDNGTGTR